MKTIFNYTLTGHRPNKLDGYSLETPFYTRLQNKLERIIESRLETHDFVVCRSGLALGADTVWSEAVLAVRKRFPNRVFFYAYEAFTGVHLRWQKENQEQFLRHKRLADYVHTTDFGERKRDRTMCIKALNQCSVDMIEPSDCVIAIWDGSRGGTGNAVRDAKKRDKELLVLHPDTFR